MQATIKTIIATPKAKATNVYAYKNNHKKNTVIICAHHDHLGHNEYNNSTVVGSRELHNGADDNASGVAAMLELSKILKGRKYRKNNYLFVAFSGEEMGLLGSKFFVQHCPISLESINYVINIDMLGRLDSNNKTLIINGTGTSPIWTKSLAKLETDSNNIRIVTSASGLGPSDHASFYLKDIPVLHFFSGQHYDYHKPSDDEEKINYQGMAQSIDVIRQIIAITNKSQKLEFTKTKDVMQGKRAFKVTLGVMPDYAFSGRGMRIDGVSENKPAQLAGLERGDVIVKLGNWEVGTVQDYMTALGNFNPGDETILTVLRKSETIGYKIKFQ